MSIRWEALGLFATLLVPLLAAIVNGVRAPERHKKKHWEDCKRLKVAIEAEHVIPKMADLMCSVWGYGDTLAAWLQSENLTEARFVEEVSLRLHSSDVVGALQELQETYQDHSDVNRLYERAVQSGRRRAAALTFGLLVAIAPVVDVTIRGFGMAHERLGWALGISALLAFGIAGVFAFLELRAENRLAELSRQYD